MVKFTLATTLVALVALFAAIQPIQGQGNCGAGVKVRKEIKALSAAERSALSTALNTLYKNGVIKKFADMHREMAGSAHGTDGFLVRHRLMIKMFEDELVAASEGKLSGLPYWDTTRDARNPKASVVLTPDYMGTADQGCVQNGPAAGWKLADGRCVQRGLSSASWVSTSVISGSLTAIPDYRKLSTLLEAEVHFLPHVDIGPTMADTNISPWDPVFWMHHGGIDYWWAQWESTGKSGSYNGPSVTMGNLRHTDAIDYQNRLCYRYDGIDGKNTTSSSPGTQRGRPTPSPSPNANQTDIVIPDLGSIPDDKLKSFNLKREDINQLDGIFKVIAAYLKKLKDEGKPLPSVESLKSFKLPKPIEDMIKGINTNSQPEDKKSDEKKPEDNKPEGGNAEGQKSSAIGFNESRLSQIFGFTFASLLALTL